MTPRILDTTFTRLRGLLGFLTVRSPAITAVLVFAAVTFLFTTLLSLPFSTRSGQATPLPDAIFTAVSSLTVTGLTSVDTAVHWSPPGQLIILAAIQTGGFGVITMALMLARAVTRRLGLGGKLFAQGAIGSSGLGDVARLLRTVVITTFTMEGVLALMLVPVFTVIEGSLGAGLWHGIFYSISAFCNAGFSIHEGGLASFAENPAVTLPLMIGVFVGSLGFPVYLNLIRAKWTRKRWSLHTKLTLWTTLILLVLGAINWGVFEWMNPQTVGDDPWWSKILNAIFASVMMRSGGFEVVAAGMSTQTTLLLTDALMFIGGGSASTAGGIKVTTIAVLFLAIVAEARGTKSTIAMRRSIPHTTLRLAISVTFLSALLVFSGAALLSIVTDAKLDRILFETVSAFATCGLSVGISADVAPFGKIVLSALMLIGRIGPIVLASALAVRHRREFYQLPEERPVIG